MPRKRSRSSVCGSLCGSDNGVGEKMKDKFILDAACGGRCFWFNKHHPNTLYIDKRRAEKGHSHLRKNHCIIPDKIMDFTNLEFSDGSFKLVVFDPSHLKSLGETF